MRGSSTLPTVRCMGDAEVFPAPESYEGRADPLGSLSCYEEGKRFGETLCKAHHDEFALDTRLGRIFNSYGPRLRAEGLYGRVVSRFLLQPLKGEDITVYGDGPQTRSFCYVSGTVTAILLTAGRDGLAGEVFEHREPGRDKNNRLRTDHSCAVPHP